MKMIKIIIIFIRGDWGFWKSLLMAIGNYWNWWYNLEKSTFLPYLFLINILFGVNIDELTGMRNDTETFCLAITQFSPRVMSCKTVSQSYNQDIGIVTVKIKNNAIKKKMPLALLRPHSP